MALPEEPPDEDELAEDEPDEDAPEEEAPEDEEELDEFVPTEVASEEPPHEPSHVASATAAAKRTLRSRPVAWRSSLMWIIWALEKSHGRIGGPTSLDRGRTS